MVATRSEGRGGQGNLFGYESPKLTALHREVFKWVQSLDLSQSLRNPRRDCASGFIVAELLSRYFPTIVNMHSFSDALSTKCRRDDWDQVQKVCRKKGFQLPQELVDGTLHQEIGAAEALLELLYEHLTQKQIRRAEEIPEDRLEAQQPKKQATTSSRDGGAHAALPGTYGASAISKSAKLPEQLQFGSIKKRDVADAMALRKQLG